MKKTILIIAIMFGLMSITTAQVQDKTKADKKHYLNTVKFSTFSFISGTFQISYERFLKANKSLEIFAGYTYRDNWEDKREGFNVEMQYKYFVFNSEGRKTTKKLYFAPYASFHYTDLTNDEYYWYYNDEPPYEYYTKEHFIINSFRGGVVFGFNWILADRITLDTYFGGGIRKTNDFNEGRDTYYSNDIWEPGFNGIAPKIGFNIGINF